MFRKKGSKIVAVFSGTFIGFSGLSLTAAAEDNGSSTSTNTVAATSSSSSSITYSDLILNTSGGLLGYCAIKLYSNIVNTSSIIQDRDIVEKQEFKNIEEGEPYHK